MQKGDEGILAEANGAVYTYRVSEALSVIPDDTWMAKPPKGRGVVTPQACIENLNDVFTLGPERVARFVVRVDRAAQSSKRLTAENAPEEREYRPVASRPGVVVFLR